MWGYVISVEEFQAFRDDYRALLKELIELPRTVKIRKMNDLAKRSKQVAVMTVYGYPYSSFSFR
ncbi:MAG: hypothetical protein GY696_07560 [Gammaproteobacteria bacterium]|nr:hypothetical protein [Gammaproteobacteria bacterium]